MPTLQEIEKVYRNSPELNASKLKEILASPAMYYKRYIEKSIPYSSSYSLSLGTKIHAALLQPELIADSFHFFDGDYPYLPAQDFASVMGSSKWKIVKEENDLIYFEVPKTDLSVQSMLDKLASYFKREVILPHEVTNINKLIADLKNNPVIVEFLDKEFQTELPIFHNGYKCKLDGLLDNSIIFDYKSTIQPINPQSLAKVISKLSYEFSAAWYFDLTSNFYPIESFYWIFQNKITGDSALVRCPDELLDVGRSKYTKALNILDTCTTTNDWSDFPSNKIAELDITPYLYFFKGANENETTNDKEETGSFV